MPEKILIPLHGNDVAPRFDLATEVLITARDKNIANGEEKIVVLSRASAEKLCHLIVTEEVDVLICSGIEEEYYQYLTWKKVQVIDSVLGPWESVLKRFYEGMLQPGDILFDKKD
ncbi:MAG: dinitrogenase iron-molybdenum cofactor biosynthesis protein [Deltaproteobacteria bacterium]|nr:dinitrogenase iron-molybdenum cofactor biosynthesis protein [Deltaproteobacteria bacterium]MBW1957888.1 dinitrogenase iron-molybdenum cofactor biosynthesis protein [Deltaproteobacteria bacterium]MBW2013211.1 dinitrogenase iron-molybdenum cofactor biosynthesis protein [Deltaproteobacteria bacterium]MBW2088854.1 dinitrogenase iron-molybdenum cofactor biosynthesis protein [Deltaproteobacteria bacterium]MBW2321195.1 dinitrogenase iron-molybdenum cofactor biosynthesis protein [Deltaproteobacteria